MEAKVLVPLSSSGSRDLEPILDRSTIEPLDLLVWAKSFCRLSASFDNDQEQDIPARLRKAFHLLVLSPAQLRHWFAPAISEEVFERILAESLDLAALSLLSGGVHYEIVRRDVGEGAVIRIQVPTSTSVIEINSSSMAQGIICALSETVDRLVEPNEIRTD